MPDIRWVCLSDLHFGAENSLLTHLVTGPEGVPVVDPSLPSSVLKALVAALAELINSNEDQTRRPTLVLNGDILELALASDEVALMAFERFIELAFVAEDLFDHHIVYVPGNHDHHLWETARERQYAAYVERRAAGMPLGPPWHSTEISEGPEAAMRLVHSELMEAIFRRHSRLQGVIVEIRYPTFALASAVDGCVAFHHGHFLEAEYLLMTWFRKALFPASKDGPDVWDIEGENFAWIDFFWSTLGRSGPWGRDVGLLYEMLQDEHALIAVTDNLAAKAADLPPKWAPVAARRWVARQILRRIAQRAAATERSSSSGSQLSAKAWLRLEAFVGGPLARQLRPGEEDPSLPPQLRFVFGHTHRPFEEMHQIAGTPVAVYNTGGWVVDSLEPDARQGAAAVLVDEHNNVASLHLYRQQGDSAAGDGVGIGAAGTGPNPLVDRLLTAVDPAAPAWATLTSAVGTAVPLRYKALRANIDQGIVAAKLPGPA